MNLGDGTQTLVYSTCYTNDGFIVTWDYRMDEQQQVSPLKGVLLTLMKEDMDKQKTWSLPFCFTGHKVLSPLTQSHRIMVQEGDRHSPMTPGFCGRIRGSGIGQSCPGGRPASGWDSQNCNV